MNRAVTNKCVQQAIRRAQALEVFRRGADDVDMSADEGNSTDIVDLIQGFVRHVNATLNETLLEAEKHQNFGASVESLGLTSIIGRKRDRAGCATTTKPRGSGRRLTPTDAPFCDFSLASDFRGVRSRVRRRLVLRAQANEEEGDQSKFRDPKNPAHRWKADSVSLSLSLQIVSIRSIGNIGSQASLMSDAGPPGIPTHNRSSKKLLSPTPSSGGTEFHTPQQPEPTRAPPHTHTSMMYNPMCTINCNSSQCHHNHNHNNGDPGPSSIEITVSDAKVFGQSHSCSQFPDF